MRRLFNFWGRLVRRGSKGITLAELMVAMAVGSMVATVGTQSLFTLIIQSSKASQHIVGTGQTQAAGYWIERDATNALTITPSPNQFTLTASTPLYITYVDWSSDNTSIKYWVDSNKKLQRYKEVKDVNNNLLSSQTTQIADNIYSVTAQYSTPTGSNRKMLQFTVVAYANAIDDISENITRSYSISPKCY